MDIVKVAKDEEFAVKCKGGTATQPGAATTQPAAPVTKGGKLLPGLLVGALCNNFTKPEESRGRWAVCTHMRA